jgi:hypothetical protein
VSGAIPRQRLLLTLIIELPSPIEEILSILEPVVVSYPIHYLNSMGRGYLRCLGSHVQY